MAYHRSGHGARGLNNSFLRRRSLLKRILQERAKSASRTVQSTQALLIGLGGTPTISIQPIGETTASPSEAAGTSQDTSGHLLAEVDPQVQGVETGVFGGDTGQVALRQTEEGEVPVQTSASTLKPSSENASSSATPLPLHRTQLRPSHGQPESFREASPSPPVLSLVVSPISGSLPPLLNSDVSTRASASSPTSAGSGTSSVDPVSTDVDDASSAPPLSQNPPIIVGILMVILIALAAVVALVSWLTRSARRRRKNCLEALTFKTDISDEDLAKMDSHPFEGTDMREALDHAQSGRTPITPFYIEPNSAIFTHENYPQDAEIHDRLRVHQGAYLPSFVPDDTTSYRLHRNGISFGDRALSQPGSRQTTTAKAHPDPWLHEPNFLLHDDPSVPKTSSRATNEIDIIMSKSGESRSFNGPSDLPSPNAQLGVMRPPPRSGLSWADALRSNLVSVLDVVRHATGTSNSQPASVGDQFTPLPLRPGREASIQTPQRRSTQEDYDITFGRGRSQTRSNISAIRSQGQSGDESEEEEGLGALKSRDSQPNAQRGAAIGGLGRFSFEQRMANSRPQTLNISYQNERRNGVDIHSTALSRRRSGMASGSGSSSHSTPGSDLGVETTMRKRRLNVS